jgi:hypothetical protein
MVTGARLDDIEIAYPSDAHVSLVCEKGLRPSGQIMLGSGIRVHGAALRRSSD